MSALTIEELHEICGLTLKLIELRQNERKHLCIENAAPELMARLYCELATAKSWSYGMEK